MSLSFLPSVPFFFLYSAYSNFLIFNKKGLERYVHDIKDQPRESNCISIEDTVLILATELL